MSFEAEGFAAGESLAIFLITPEGAFTLAPSYGYADSAGHVFTRYNFQSNLRPLVAGSWRIRIIGEQSGTVAEGTFVIAPEALPPAPDNRPSPTPLTDTCAGIETLDLAGSEARGIATKLLQSAAAPSGATLSEVLWVRKANTIYYIAVRTSDGDLAPAVLTGTPFSALYIASLDEGGTPESLIAAGSQKGIMIPQTLVDLEQCPLGEPPAS